MVVAIQRASLSSDNSYLFSQAYIPSGHFCRLSWDGPRLCTKHPVAVGEISPEWYTCTGQCGFISQRDQPWMIYMYRSVWLHISERSALNDIHVQVSVASYLREIGPEWYTCTGQCGFICQVFSVYLIQEHMYPTTILRKTKVFKNYMYWQTLLTFEFKFLG